MAGGKAIANIGGDLGKAGGNAALDVGRNAALDIGKNVGADIGRNVGADIGRNVGADIGRNVGADIGRNVGSDVGRNVGSDVGRNVGSDVGRNVGSDVGRNVLGDAGSDLGRGAVRNLDDVAIRGVSQNMALDIQGGVLKAGRGGSDEFLERVGKNSVDDISADVGRQADRIGGKANTVLDQSDSMKAFGKEADSQADVLRKNMGKSNLERNWGKFAIGGVLLLTIGLPILKGESPSKAVADLLKVPTAVLATVMADAGNAIGGGLKVLLPAAGEALGNAAGGAGKGLFDGLGFGNIGGFFGYIIYGIVGCIVLYVIYYIWKNSGSSGGNAGYRY